MLKRLYRNLRHKWYDWRQYRSNIKYYKEFLKMDTPYDNASIYTVLRLKLHKTADHYSSGLLMPYVNFEDDHQTIIRALFLARDIEQVLDNQYSADPVEFANNNEELFNLLKECYHWWD